MTIILPMGWTSTVLIIFVFMFDILSVKSRANILSRLVPNVIPYCLNLSTPKFSFRLVFIESVLYCFEPIHTTCVFEKFTLRPEHFEKFSSSLSVSFRDSSDPSSMTDVSSAY